MLRFGARIAPVQLLAAGIAVSPPQALKPLLQSRGCGSKTAAWHIDVETQAKRFYVSGTVQGVGFRFFVERMAARIGVSGYVTNLFDERVEVYAIGTAAQLEALKTELWRGPHMAGVEKVAESDAVMLSEYSNGFTIEPDY
jgi:acylphosphatase